VKTGVPRVKTLQKVKETLNHIFCFYFTLSLFLLSGLLTGLDLSNNSLQCLDYLPFERQGSSFVLDMIPPTSP
jgi:hypothetical protein